MSLVDDRPWSPARRGNEAVTAAALFPSQSLSSAYPPPLSSIHGGICAASGLSVHITKNAPESGSSFMWKPSDGVAPASHRTGAGQLEEGQEEGE